MNFNLKNLIEKYKLGIKGIIHIGANKGEEYNLYKSLGIKNLVLIEPRSEEFRLLKKNIKDPDCILIQKALGNKTGKEKMFISYGRNSAGASSSILKPKKHLELHKGIKFHETVEEVDIDKLDNLGLNNSKYNMINIDVQGYELEVFYGSDNTLQNIDYILTEINRDEVYENCAQIDKLDQFLNLHKFKRVETDWCGNLWGDAFYVKNV